MLQPQPVLERAGVVAEVQRARWPHAGEDSLLRAVVSLSYHSSKANKKRLFATIGAKGVRGATLLRPHDRRGTIFVRHGRLRTMPWALLTVPFRRFLPVFRLSGRGSQVHSLAALAPGFHLSPAL